jgi:histidinol-phosphate phosphatase family protein
MPVTSPPIAVLVGPPGKAAPAALTPALLAALDAAGIPRNRLGSVSSAPLQLELPTAAIAGTNLGALVARQRAAGRGPAAWLDRDQRWTGVALRARDGDPGAPLAALVDDPARARVPALLMDRDGTLIADHPYLAAPAGVVLLPGAATALRRLARAGLRLAVLTNQSGVGRGWITPAELDAVHLALRAALAETGVTLDGIFVCPHRPDEGCACRKPRDGLARQAAARLGLTLAETLVAGDKAADILLGRRIGARTALVLTGEGRETFLEEPEAADLVVEDLAELAALVCHPAGPGMPVHLPAARLTSVGIS